MGNDLKLTGNYAADITNLIQSAKDNPIWSDATLAKIINTPRKGDTLESLLSGTFMSATATSISAKNGQDQLTGTMSQVSVLFAQVNTLTPSEPSPSDSSHPAGSLKVDDKGVITTPGGYKIEATGQYEWKITDKDGKSETRVWGDPHVAEKDGGKWDFKRDSTFVLGDGTRINCQTAPWNNMTVTKGLEIISGNDRVCVTDIDKGKGKVGDITKDGFSKVNSFGNKDVFVMGTDADDWTFNGKEIIGSNNGGDSFKLGKDMAPGEVAPLVEKNKANGSEFFTKMYNQIAQMFDALIKGMGPGGKMPDMSNMKFPELAPESAGAFQKNGLDMIKKSFEAVSLMFQALQKIMDLADMIKRPTNLA
jgi:hypothetical protein